MVGYVPNHYRKIVALHIYQISKVDGLSTPDKFGKAEVTRDKSRKIAIGPLKNNRSSKSRSAPEFIKVKKKTLNLNSNWSI